MSQINPVHSSHPNILFNNILHSVRFPSGILISGLQKKTFAYVHTNRAMWPTHLPPLQLVSPYQSLAKGKNHKARNTQLFLSS
jgi:hypothetical protein